MRSEKRKNFGKKNQKNVEKSVQVIKKEVTLSK